ncbi:hypothetical protein AAE478_007042 [Parahypoxylon ruwenzoriense]
MPFNPSKWHFEIDDYLNPWIPAAPWKHLPSPIARFMGHRPEHQPPLGNIAMVFWAFIGVLCSLIIIQAVSHAIPSFEERGAPIIIASLVSSATPPFPAKAKPYLPTRLYGKEETCTANTVSQGAAAVLEFYAIESPLSQPRNAVIGQFFASVIGVAVRKLFALSPQSQEMTWLGGSLSCACAVAVMALTGTVHPPAGATALLAVVDEGVARLGWFLLPVVLLGCVLMQAVALLFNNIQRRFPVYWWTPAEVGHRLRHRKAQQREERGGGVRSDSEYENGSENGAKLEITSTRHLEEGRAAVDEVKLVITRGHVSIPDNLYLSPEEKLFLEELSERI